MASTSFTGGEGLLAALDKIAQGLKKGAAVDVGFMEGATYPDGQSVAEVAAFNEFGTRTAPPRPFFRNAIAANQGKWPANIAAALKTNDYDASVALDLVGQEIQEEVQEAIREFTTPGLAQSTIERKGFDKPLIDTANMVNSPTHKVR